MDDFKKDKPFKKKIYIKDFDKLKEKLYKKANKLQDDFKKGDAFVTKRVNQMVNNTQDYVRQKDIQGRIKKINWVKGVKALLLIFIIVGTIASQNPILYGTVVKAVVIATENSTNLSGIKAILPIFKTLINSLGNIEKIMLFVNIMNVFIDDVPGALALWKYDTSTLTSFTRKALKSTLDARNKAYENIKYVENNSDYQQPQSSKEEKKPKETSGYQENQLGKKLTSKKRTKKV